MGSSKLLCAFEGFMYILGSDKEVIDLELGMLQEVLQFLDSKLISVESEIEASNDPFSDGILTVESTLSV